MKQKDTIKPASGKLDVRPPTWPFYSSEPSFPRGQARFFFVQQLID
jgi:hypothetical protein